MATPGRGRSTRRAISTWLALPLADYLVWRDAHVVASVSTLGRLKGMGKTVFLNSHLFSEIEMVCDRVAIIDRGRIVRQGALAELLAERELDLTIGNLTPALFESIAAR